MSMVARRITMTTTETRAISSTVAVDEGLGVEVEDAPPIANRGSVVLETEKVAVFAV